ncbi:hypothetical protein BT63DRAFT_421652 [Microthyrium microscopicum]|uniref:Uncharacterized protein n=1 Tax=Microthyrium microscopicum TaxID=703497 RepID=A0A6A6UQ53_9PEZI|nr:hypothetical protein BT63DRAFT_421652 [Microthyrium microscopicum]
MGRIAAHYTAICLSQACSTALSISTEQKPTMIERPLLLVNPEIAPVGLLDFFV